MSEADLTPKCPHCNGILEQIHYSPIHFAVGSDKLRCRKCGRKWILKEQIKNDQ